MHRCQPAQVVHEVDQADNHRGALQPGAAQQLVPAEQVDVREHVLDPRARLRPAVIGALLRRHQRPHSSAETSEVQANFACDAVATLCFPCADTLWFHAHFCPRKRDISTS